MKCKKCGSENVSSSVVNEVTMEKQNKGCLYNALIRWWWSPIKWLFFTGWALLFKLFGKGKQKAVNKRITVWTCNNCGYSWEK